MADKITVAPMDPEQKNSPIAGPVEDEATVMLDSASKFCLWNGQEFTDGQIIEAEGTAYECSFGQWVRQS